jgi:hypothetical protein
MDDMKLGRALLPLTLVLALPGCDEVFGLAPPDDASFVEHRVTGVLWQKRVTNDASGTAVYDEVVFPPGRASAIVVFPDRTQVPVEIDDEGAFSFVRPAADTPYRLVVLADTQVFEVQHASPSLVLRVPVLGRPNAERDPVTKPTPVATPAFAGLVLFTSTGLWAIANTYSNGTQQYTDWRTSTSLSGRRGLLSAAKNDRFYALEYVQTSYVHIRSILEAEIEMTDGEPVNVSATPRAASPTVCAHLTADFEEHAEAFYAAVPSFVYRSRYWHIQSLPSVALGLAGTIDLAYMPVPEGAGLDVTATAENPFPGTDTTAVGRVLAQRALAYPGAYAIPLYAEMRRTERLEPTLNCDANRVDVTPIVGVPGRFTLDGKPLDDDATQVEVARGSEAMLTWELVVDDPVDRYSVALFEVFEEETSGITTLRAIRSFHTVEPALAIDSAMLLPGAYYIIRVVAELGYAGAREGDLGTITAPVSMSYSYTGMFQVQ